MGDRNAKDVLFDALASVAKALASGRRVEIVEVLAQGPRSVEEVADEIGQSVANTSHHLRTLAASGLLRSRRDGTRVIYALAGPEVEDLWHAVREVARAHVAEIDALARDYLGEPSDLEPVTCADLAERLRDGDVTVIDVRPALEYEAGHVPGARPVPLSELSERLEEIPDRHEIVAYCRGPYCVFADDAVRVLREHGFRARRLEEGFPDWRRAGFPVETGPEPADLAESNETAETTEHVEELPV